MKHPLRTLFLGAAALLTGYALVENKLWLRTVKDPLTTEEMGFRVPRMVMVSDVHKRQFGKNNKRLVAAVAAAKPEVIILTGDLVSRSMEDFSQTDALLKGLASIAPMLMVWGNHEMGLHPEDRGELRRILKKHHVRLLENEIIRVGDVHFAGLSLSRSHYRTEHGYGNLRRCTAGDIQAKLGDCPPNTILLVHNPLFATAYAAWGADLVLSGHVHGGVLRLPLLGGVLSPERRFFPAYSKGRYDLGQTVMIVSGGLGKLRLFNPPEIRCIFTVH